MSVATQTKINKCYITVIPREVREMPTEAGEKRYRLMNVPRTIAFASRRLLMIIIIKRMW